MTTDEPGSQLRGALLVLTAVARELRRDARQPLPPAPFAALQGTVGSLTRRRAASPLPCPEPFRQVWLSFATDRRQQIEAHVLRHLCWDVEAATDARFHDYLDRQRIVLGSRSLQGLVRACHHGWSEELAEGAAVRAVWRRVGSYAGPNPLLLRWKSALSMLLAPQGPREFGKAMLERLAPVKVWCQSWGLDEQSPFVQDSVRHAAQVCRDQIERSGPSAPCVQYLLTEVLPWSGWRLLDFQAECAALILHTWAASLWKPVTHLILHDSRLGDPRLPGNDERWVGMPEATCQRVIQWLSRAAIEGRS
jgi:hypothetical protein